MSVTIQGTFERKPIWMWRCDKCGATASMLTRGEWAHRELAEHRCKVAADGSA